MTKELVKSREDGDNLTMEEILASIRGIINDDMIENTSKTKKTDKNTEEDIFELTEIIEDAAEENAASTTQIHQQESSEAQELPSINEVKEDKVELSNNQEKDIQTTQITETLDLSTQSEELIDNVTDLEITPEETQKQRNTSSVISEATANKASNTIKDLINKAQKTHSDGLGFRSGITVEDLAIEAMRPYLVRWMDEHLPGIVKHLVQKEIQKLVPRDDE